MGYFRELPNLEYLSPLSNRTSSSEYIEVKNLFKRIKIRDDLQNIFTVFDKYEIQEDKRPDQVAEELYGSPNLDWVVLITAEIINIKDQWPLSNNDLFNFVYDIYGEEINSTHHYETKEVKDSNGRLILPAGQVVDYNFKSPRPEVDNQITSSYVSFYDSKLKQYDTKYNITVPVTNLEYETRKNDEKRTIYVLKRGYLQQFLNDSRQLMLHSQSSQYVNDRLKKADNIRVKSP
jgi:hypothetical protein